MGACRMQPEQTIRRARRLRKTPTRAEDFFWSLVRDRALDGLRFRRQVPIGAYVVDFACLSARLIIEADGGVTPRSTLLKWTDETPRASAAAFCVIPSFSRT